jgi:hypothetical protein
MMNIMYPHGYSYNEIDWQKNRVASRISGSGEFFQPSFANAGFLDVSKNYSIRQPIALIFGQEQSSES